MRRYTAGTLAILLFLMAWVAPVPVAIAQEQIKEIAGKVLDLVFRVEDLGGKVQDLQVKETFDMSLGIGYFDYLENPIEDLRKMVQCTKGHVFASFPKRFEWRVPVRKVRFMLTGGFVRFYSKADVLQLFTEIGVPADRLYLIDLGRDYVAVARVI